MTRPRERGSALLSTLLIMMLMSAMLVGFLAVVMADQRAGLSNRDQTTAYAAAHAGLEQLTADLGEMFATSFRPTSAQVNGLVASPPDLGAGVTYATPGGGNGTGYRISFDDANNDGFPDTEPTARDIQSGPYFGLKGIVTPYRIEVTAATGTRGEVRMRREMQTVLIPAFQFGIYSENDLSFFAGPDFDFGGRVHTNSNLFLAEGNGRRVVAARPHHGGGRGRADEPVERVADVEQLHGDGAHCDGGDLSHPDRWQQRRDEHEPGQLAGRRAATASRACARRDPGPWQQRADLDRLLHDEHRVEARDQRQPEERTHRRSATRASAGTDGSVADRSDPAARGELGRKREQRGGVRPAILRAGKPPHPAL